MVNGVCQLAESSGTSIPPLYIAGGAAAIGAAVIGIVFAVRRGASGTSTPKPTRQDLDDYEDQYLSRQRIEPSPKSAETRQTSSSCGNCGASLKPTAKFCGKCGSRQ
jgi:ribosomal protein L40E